ncbi:MAG TPA: acylphosphatase [Candidatus Aminicenantes bacterium]|nr:acylphosphatase [Candidatus Aminicenantes bacterium]
MITRRYVVSGRVQGVGFRYFVVRAAEMIDIRGSVRNQWDGTVEVVAQGSEEQLTQLEGHLHRGPHYATIESVVGADWPDAPDFPCFDVTD